MITSIATVIGTISFVTQKIMEFLKPLLEKYIPWFDFSDIKYTQSRVDLLEKVYGNTLAGTKAGDIEIIDKGNDFKFDEKMTDVIKLKAKLAKRVRQRGKAKALRYMLLGILLGIVICLVVSKVTGLTFFGLADNYKEFENSNLYWIIDSVIAGILVGFGSKPVNDVLNYFNNNEKQKVA